MNLRVCFFLGAAALIGCGSDGSSSSSGGGGAGAGGAGAGGAPPVTFHRDVEPLLQTHCLTCHTEGRIGGFSLATYEEVAPLASLIADVTASGQMPPWHARTTDECEPRFGFRDDPRLTDQERSLLALWSELGAPEGDLADAPPPFTPDPVGLPDPTVQLTPATAGVVSGDNDIFECVRYDPALAETQYLEGIHIVPGNTAVAHHALMFRVDRAASLAAGAGEERYPCFESPGGELIGAWAPGAVPLELPPTVGMEISPDDVIVVQMHYHPTASEETDQSTLELRFTEEVPVWRFQIALVGNARNAPELLPDPDDAGEPAFVIPAGAQAHVEEMEFQVPADVPIEVPILSVGTHMHYVGVEARYWVTRPEPSAGEPPSECLVETPAWDFNWQRGYMYDADISDLPTISAGDVLHMRCVYNNSLSNRFVVEALEAEGLSAPQEVRLGEATLDEMCLGVTGILIPNVQ